MWKALHKVLGERAQRIEVRMPDGLPDVLVNLGGGRAAWIELKLGRVDYRTGQDTWVRAPQVSLEQAIWLTRWRKGGGLGGVLVFDPGALTYAYVTGDFRGLRKEGTLATWAGADLSGFHI